MQSEGPVLKTHEIKCWQKPFQATWDGDKTYEIRVDDRGYEVGDTLHQREWDVGLQRYTGRAVVSRVTYKTEGGNWGLPKGICVLGIKVTGREQVDR